MVISAEMCVSGRDLTEPRLSPDGALVAIVVRWGSSAGIVVVPVGGGPERLVTTLPAPSPGRGLGGGCHTWLPDGSALVYASGGGLWSQPIGAAASQRGALRVTHHGDESTVRSPSVAPDGAHVAYTVDEAQVWVAPLAGSALPRRIDDGSADFCFDPHIAGDGTVRWQAWSVPDMPWDGAHVEVVALAGASGPDGSGGPDGAGEPVERERRRGSGAIQQPRTLPDGRPIEVRDDTGWLNVWVDDTPVVDEPFEHAGPSWGSGQRSFAASPDGRRIAFARNEAGFGRLCVVDLADGAVTEIARGVHGQLDWAGDHLVAIRTGARTPTRVVAYDTTDEPWSRHDLLVGPVEAWDHLDPAELPEPDAVTIDAGGVTLHARRYRAAAEPGPETPTGSGRMICWIHGGPTD
ncbi:MAG: hypothetical protein WD225_04795, partial [Ilumatobacteraceae bacterium]